MSVSVRPATVDDVDAAVDLYAEVAGEGRWIAGEAPVDKLARHARFETSVRRDDAQMFVAELDGRIVGELGIELASYGVAELGMMVATGVRGRGVGSALLAAAIDWARQAGAHKIALQVWPHNEPALALYRKFGFEQEGYLSHHYRRANGEQWDAIVMGLLLRE
ncbi:MAG: GNAT family N-acetyltransferase [Acidimicrobiales bacterium]|nr:GNAT family N-acetyltransferase [Acidimicrobiales bacterium]